MDNVRIAITLIGLPIILVGAVVWIVAALLKKGWHTAEDILASH